MIDKEMEDEEAEETRNLGKVCVTFDDATDTGLHLDDMMAVSSIEAGSAAALSLRVDKGFIVVSAVIGEGPSETELEIKDGGDWTLATAVSKKARIYFERPPLEMPPQGWARKAFTRKTNRRLTKEQKDWLDENFKGKTGERKRDKKIYLEMKEKFGMRLTEDRKGLLCLKQSQIRSFISRKWAKIKKEALDRSREAAEGGSDDEAEGEEEEEEEDETSDDDFDYRGLTIPELKQMIAKRGITTAARTSRNVMIQLIDEDDAENDR